MMMTCRMLVCVEHNETSSETSSSKIPFSESDVAASAD